MHSKTLCPKKAEVVWQTYGNDNHSYSMARSSVQWLSMREGEGNRNNLWVLVEMTFDMSLLKTPKTKGNTERKKNREGRWKWVENYKPRRNKTNGVWDNRRIFFSFFSEREWRTWKKINVLQSIWDKLLTFNRNLIRY